MLRIAYDARKLFNNFTGLGNYSRTLLRNLSTYFPEDLYFLFTNQVVRHEETSYFLNSPMFHVQYPAAMSPIRALKRPGTRRLIQRHHIELFHGLANELPYQVHQMPVSTLVTIHDLTFKRYPHYYSYLQRQRLDMQYRHACRHADRLVATSHNTKKDIVEFYEVDPQRIEVIYQSCNERYLQEKPPKVIRSVRKRYQLPEAYLLYVGAITPRKNLLTLIQALELIPPDRRLPLVVVGRGQNYLREVKRYIARRRLGRWVQFLRPDFEDMPVLYQQARLFVYPSRYEGFGIPILEALFSRTPVITSNVASMPEAAGADAYLVNPEAPEALAHGIETVLADEALRQNMIEQGFIHAQQFLGEPLTRQLRQLYESMRQDAS